MMRGQLFSSLLLPPCQPHLMGSFLWCDTGRQVSVVGEGVSPVEGSEFEKMVDITASHIWIFCFDFIMCTSVVRVGVSRVSLCKFYGYNCCG